MAEYELLEGKRVLLVDDELDVLDTLEDLLPMCETEKASNFDDARSYLENAYFDIAIFFQATFRYLVEIKATIGVIMNVINR